MTVFGIGQPNVIVLPVPPRVRATTDSPASSGADTIVVGVFEGEGVAHDLPGEPLGALLDSGEASPKLGKVAHTHAEELRWILVGLGKRDAFDVERARVAAGKAWERARAIGTRSLCWELPHHVSEAHAAGVVEGTLLAAYEFRAFKTSVDESGDLAELIVSAHHSVREPVEHARVIAEAVNQARDLQNTPSNEKPPVRLAALARELADEHDSLTAEVLLGDAIQEAGMGAFASVAKGSVQQPALITLRYEPAEVAGPPLGFVGKAVTFDAGGISLKPANKMSDMKFDMSGGAAVLYATAAIARLGLPVRLVSVVGATENLPSGSATKPGDIVRAKDGTTVEVINTDAEGRMVLADCLVHAIEQGAERLVDVATLTGGIVTTFGNVYAGLFANDDEWAAELEAAGGRSGERVWRLPLDQEYTRLLESKYADVVNANEDRKATSIVGAEFLKRFAGDVPWAHLDIAGVASDNGRAYTPRGGSGFGVRLLVELARANGAAPDLH
jgi:leucyl aminopeptidase